MDLFTGLTGSKVNCVVFGKGKVEIDRDRE